MADSRLVEVVAVFVELKTDKQATEQEIVDYCRRYLASFKIPHRMLFLHDWPMTGAGKIQRYVLKRMLSKE
jgi:fatty-acyl-CoA synthase